MSSQEPSFHSGADALSDDRIQDLLKPLQDVDASIEYLNQYKAMKAFNQRLHDLETLFGDVYSKLSSLEIEIAKQKEKNRAASREASSNIWDNFS